MENGDFQLPVTPQHDTKFGMIDYVRQALLHAKIHGCQIGVWRVGNSGKVVTSVIGTSR